MPFHVLVQISELCLQRQQLQKENRALSEKDVQNVADMETLRRHLSELIEENERKEEMPPEDRYEVSR